MSLLTPPATVLDLQPAPAPTTPSTTPQTRRVLAVVLRRQEVDEHQPIAADHAPDTARELHVAVLLPRLPFTFDAALLARLADSADREAADLVTLVSRRTAASGVRTKMTLHLLRGLHGPRRQRVVDRTVARLARRLDAEPAPRADG